jgi:hypothetical protein
VGTKAAAQCSKHWVAALPQICVGRRGRGDCTAPHRTAPHRTVQVEKQRARKRMNDVLQAAAKAGGAAAAAAGKRLHLRYLLAPEELLADGGGRLRAVRLRRMRLTERRRGLGRALGGRTPRHLQFASAGVMPWAWSGGAGRALGMLFGVTRSERRGDGSEGGAGRHHGGGRQRSPLQVGRLPFTPNRRDALRAGHTHRNPLPLPPSFAHARARTGAHAVRAHLPLYNVLDLRRGKRAREIIGCAGAECKGTRLQERRG